MSNFVRLTLTALIKFEAPARFYKHPAIFQSLPIAPRVILPLFAMKKNTRKSSAFISLVLVPLNLMGLGFTGCDSRDDDVVGADVEQANVDFDSTDPNDVFNLEPVADSQGGPVAYPATQPLAASGFASQPAYHSTYSHSGIIFVPVPYRTGYRPPLFGVGSSRSSFGSSGVSRSYSSGSSGMHSSSTSHGGFGSTGHASASS